MAWKEREGSGALPSDGAQCIIGISQRVTGNRSRSTRPRLTRAILHFAGPAGGFAVQQAQAFCARWGRTYIVLSCHNGLLPYCRLSQCEAVYHLPGHPAKFEAVTELLGTHRLAPTGAKGLFDVVPWIEVDRSKNDVQYN